MASPASPFTTIDDVQHVWMGEGPRLVVATSSSSGMFGLPNMRIPEPESDQLVTRNLVGGAVDVDIAAARARADGEFWERYAVYARPPIVLADASQRELPSPSVGVQDLLAGDRGPSYAGEEADEDTPMDWVPGVHVRSGDPWYLPAEAVHLGYTDVHGRPQRFWDWTTTGAACGQTSEDALARAVLELIERDAIMWHWLRHEGGEPVPVEEWSRLVDQRVVDAVRRCAPWTAHVVRLQGVVPVPVVLAAFVHPEQQPAFTIGLACHPDLPTAYRKALLEAVQILYPGLNRKRPPLPRWSARSFEDRLWLYADPEQLEHVDWLIRESPGAPVSPNRDGCADPVQALHSVGLETYASDITPRDVAAVGCHVVRAIVPGLQTMEPDHAYRVVHRDRVGLRWDDVNPLPHPIA